MNKYKIPFIVLLAINIIIIGCIIINNSIFKSYGTNVKDGNLDNYAYMLDGHIPEDGYVSNGDAALKIGKAVLEATFIKPQIGTIYSVEYDKKNETWIVKCANLLHDSGFAVINKKDGRVIRAWPSKN